MLLGLSSASQYVGLGVDITWPDLFDIAAEMPVQLGQGVERDRRHGVMLGIEGDAAFIDELPFVQSTRAVNRSLEVLLDADADTDELLRALVDRVHVRRFEVKQPSLHEIFVQLVGGHHE